MVLNVQAPPTAYMIVRADSIKSIKIGIFTIWSENSYFVVLTIIFAGYREYYSVKIIFQALCGKCFFTAR